MSAIKLPNQRRPTPMKKKAVNQTVFLRACLLACTLSNMLPNNQLLQPVYAQRAKEDGPHAAPPVVPLSKVDKAGAAARIDKTEKAKKSDKVEKSDKANTGSQPDKAAPAVKVDKTAAAALYKEAMMERGKGHLPTSTQKFQEALAADPLDDRIKKGLAYNYYTLGNDIRDDNVVKGNLYKKALQYDPANKKYQSALDKLNAASKTK